MDWKDQLISMFVTICQRHEAGLWVYGQNLSPNPHLLVTIRTWLAHGAEEDFYDLELYTDKALLGPHLQQELHTQGTLLRMPIKRFCNDPNALSAGLQHLSFSGAKPFLAGFKRKRIFSQPLKFAPFQGFWFMSMNDEWRLF